MGENSREIEGGGGEVEVVRWPELMLPRMPVRVLVVEADDSTRQIIAALLRKCGYRVASVSDGLKAWEMLKEKPLHVDLVLTEVDLPSISGFGLLTMIMEHETCKNIPVIMMSSHDSISIVFKCMLRGAADFLVKPIRKNEMRNLWQHVWRRQLANGEHVGTHGNQNGNPVKRKLDVNGENNPSIYSGEYVDSIEKNEDNSGKGSDAQSSCTRSDTEAESKYMKNVQELKEQKCRESILMDVTKTQNDKEYDIVSVKLVDDNEENSVMLGPEPASCIEACNSGLLVPEDHSGIAFAGVNGNMTPSSYLQINNTPNEAKPKEAIDLIWAIDHRKHSFAPRDGSPAHCLPYAAEAPSHENDFSCKLSSIPFLELSLRRPKQTSCRKQEHDESNTLHHSTSSAFSLYASRTEVPTSSIPMKSVIEQEKFLHTPNICQAVQNSGSFRNAPFHDDAELKNMEDTNSPGFVSTGQNETTMQYSLRAIPFPVPVMWQANGSVLQPMFYPQPGAHHMLNPTPTIWQEAASTDQSDCKALMAMESDHCQDRVIDEQRGVSSTVVESANSMCNDNNAVPNTPKSEELFAHDKMNQMDLQQRLNHREAALTKFRLKRKERCYEKKVRYQSRKLLAEKRPRVKGQFVRQVQPYSSDSATG